MAVDPELAERLPVIGGDDPAVAGDVPDEGLDAIERRRDHRACNTPSACRGVVAQALGKRSGSLRDSVHPADGPGTECWNELPVITGFEIGGDR